MELKVIIEFLKGKFDLLYKHIVYSSGYNDVPNFPNQSVIKVLAWKTK